MIDIARQGIYLFIWIIIEIALGGVSIYLLNRFFIRKIRIWVIYLIILIQIKYCNYLSEWLFLSEKFRVSDYCLTPNEKYFSYAMARISYIQWDDNDVCLVLDHHDELDFYSATSLKQ